MSLLCRRSIFAATFVIATTTLISVETYADSSTVLARIGKEKTVTLNDFTSRFPALASWFGLGAKYEDADKNLRGMVFESLLAQEARANGVQDRPEIKNKINQILGSAYLEERIPEGMVALDEAEIKKYYEENRDEFRQPDKWRLSHVLVKTEEEAKKVQESAKAGKAFDTLAASASIDPATSQRGGDLGWVEPSVLEPTLSQAATNLPVGKISEPLKTGFGYHVIRVEEKSDPIYRDLEEVKGELRRDLIHQKEEKLLDQVRGELFKKHQVSFDKTSLESAVNDKGAAVSRAPGPVSFPTKMNPLAEAELRLISEAIDFGTIAQKEVTQTALIANTSDQEIVIQRVGSTCKCAQASIEPKALAPGEVGTLTVTYDPTMFKEKGTSSKVVYIESTDRVKPRKILRVHAEIEEPKDVQQG